MFDSHKGKKPVIDKSCFIAENARIMGNVKIGAHSSIWFGAVLRGDVNKIFIGKNSNIQDNSVLHGTASESTSIGDNVSVGHNAIVHGCKIGSNCIIGMGAIILSGAVIGNNSIVGAGAVIKEGEVIPQKSLVVGVPGKIVRKLADKDIKRIKDNAEEYLGLMKQY